MRAAQFPPEILLLHLQTRTHCRSIAAGTDACEAMPARKDDAASCCAPDEQAEIMRKLGAPFDQSICMREPLRRMGISGLDAGHPRLADRSDGGQPNVQLGD